MEGYGKHESQIPTSVFIVDIINMIRDMTPTQMMIIFTNTNTPQSFSDSCSFNCLVRMFPIHDSTTPTMTE